MLCTSMCRVLTSEFLGSLCLCWVVLIVHWTSLHSLCSGTWGTHYLASSDASWCHTQSDTVARANIWKYTSAQIFEITGTVKSHWAVYMPLLWVNLHCLTLRHFPCTYCHAVVTTWLQWTLKEVGVWIYLCGKCFVSWAFGHTRFKGGLGTVYDVRILFVINTVSRFCKLNCMVHVRIPR